MRGAVFSELGSGNRRDHTNLPALLAGGRALGRNPGRHLAFPDSDWGDLFVSVGRRIGVQQEQFGDFGERRLPDVSV